MQSNLLILHPADPSQAVEPALILESLQAVGFVSEAMDFHGRRHYRPGEDFLQLVTFLGCSPVVSLGEPGKTGEEFCHIALPAPQPEPVLLTGANAKPPRCPVCRQADTDWRQHFQPGAPVPPAWRCGQCGASSPAHRLNWRQSAGVGRSFVLVWGIFEGEAVPSEQLLTRLEQTGGGPWNYFYYRADDAPPL